MSDRLNPRFPARPRRKALWTLLALLVAAWAIGVGVWLLILSPWNRPVGNPTDRPEPATSTSNGNGHPSPRSRSYVELVTERARMDETIWANERLANEHERTIVRLWDDLRAADDPWAVFEAIPWESVVIGTLSPPESWEHDIRYYKTVAPYRRLSHKAIIGTIAALRNAGYRLAQSEWRHVAFTPAENGRPASSTVEIELHVSSNDDQHRWIVRTDVQVTWTDRRDSQGHWLAGEIEARDVELLSRHAPPALVQLAVLDPPAEVGRRNDPLILYDLDRDGRSEIILGARNLVYRYRGGDRFEPEIFCKDLPPNVMPAMLLADLDGDALADLGYIHIERGEDGQSGLVLRLVRGKSDGKLACPGHRVMSLVGESPIVMTAGDIDHDGDLDLWIGQYRLSHRHGQMPTPYYDANDGFPAYLLRNDGDGKFVDITEQAGLGAKRRRRTYAGSLVDLNADGHLDLVVTSDFAGIDLYHGDGRGNFLDVTDQVFDERHGFGTSHAVADFDSDGALDLFMAAVSSPTARRLDHMKLVRPDRPDLDRMRAAMGFGNRMYFSRGGRLVPPKWAEQVARTGWSWGASALDFDNDGDRDLFVANGYQSGKSAQDYSTTYWRHDLYTGDSEPNSSVDLVFDEAMKPYERLEISWHGHEHKALFLNRGKRSMANVAFLMGAALGFDGRAVAADDLDGDGRMDLLVADKRPGGPTGLKQRVFVLRNRLPKAGHWIGVRLYESGGGKSPLGAVVKVVTAEGTQIAPILAGDSFASQHAPSAHFGLGDATTVDRIEVHWPDGQVERIEKPQIDRWHLLGKRPQKS